MNESETTSWRQATAMVFLWLAAGLALFLALQSVGSLPLPGCGEGASCHKVLESRFSYLLGIPMAWLGFATYCLLILTTGAWVRREETFAATLGSLLAGVATGAALWFIGVQAVLLKQWCPWCLTTHVSVLTAVVLLQRERRLTRIANPSPADSTDSASHSWMLGGLLASAALLALSGWQGKTPVASAVVVSQPATDVTRNLNASNEPEVWHLALGDYPLPLDTASLPMLGSPAAFRTAVLVTDYTCDHCRHYHETLGALVTGMEPGVRLIVLPASRDEEGKAVQRCLLSLYQVDRAAWETLHGKLIRGDVPPVPALVAEAARKLIGTEAWATAVRSHQDKVEAGLAAARKVQLHNREAYPDAAVLPQLMAGTSVLMGAESDRQVILRFINENTNPLASAPPAEPPALSGLGLQNDNIDLGKVTAGTTVRVDLKVMNRSLQPIGLGRAEMDMGLLIVTMPGSAVGGGSLLDCAVDCQVPTTAGPFIREITFHSNGQPLTARIRGLAVPVGSSLASATSSRQP